MKFVLIDAILRIWSKKLNFSNFSGKKVYLWNRKNSEVHYHVIHKDIHKRQQCFRKKEKIKRLNQKSLNRLQRQTDGVFNHLPYLKIPCSTVNSSVKITGTNLFWEISLGRAVSAGNPLLFCLSGQSSVLGRPSLSHGSSSLELDRPSMSFQEINATQIQRLNLFEFNGGN